MKTTLAICVVLLLAGCMGGGPTDEDPTGKYAYINWGKSQRSCNNDVCTYGENNERLRAPVRCNERTSFSWDVKAWIHGSIAVVVEDPEGEEKARRTFSANGRGNMTLTGSAGTWEMTATTSNANGNLQVRLTCL